jgi:hypothetical protein
MSSRDSSGAREPQVVLAVLSSLLDTVAITEAAKRSGIELVVAPPENALETIRGTRPALAVLDLTQPEVVPLIERLAEQRVPTLGFYPHVHQALKERAMRAGLGRAVPRSKFFARLSEMLAPAVPGG